MKRSYDHTMANVDFRRPWTWAVLFLMFVPLLPEYIAPFFAVFALIFAVRDAKNHHRRVRVGMCGKLIIAYMCYMLIHLLWASSPAMGLLTLFGYWLPMFCGYLALTTVLTSHQRIETTVLLLSIFIGTIGMVGCVQYAFAGVLGIPDFPLQVWDFLDAAVFDFVGAPVHLPTLGIRVAATFLNPNIYAQFIVMSLPIMAAYGFTGKNSPSKLLCRICLLLGVGGIFFSFSRGAYLAVAAIAIVMCIANIRRMIPISMVVMAVVLLLPESIYARLGSMGNASDVAITERFELWGIAMDMFSEAPLLGHGIGVGETLERLSGMGFNAPHLHNVFLQFLVEGGVVGLILLFLLLWKLFRIGFDLIIHSKKTHMYGSAIIAFCGGFCLCGVFDFPLFSPKEICIFLVMLACADSLSFLETRRNPQTLAMSFPFADTLLPKLENWIKKTTAPKE